MNKMFAFYEKHSGIIDIGVFIFTTIVFFYVLLIVDEKLNTAIQCGSDLCLR